MFHCDTMLHGRPAVLLAFLSLAAAMTPSAVHAQGTRFLRQPDVSSSHIAFVHANDLWLAGRDGGNAVRLTSSDGAETDPAFSADGRWIAFSGQYGGNTDVYVMPAAGGQPERLTWHPAPDIVQGWTPEGAILFQSSREAVPTMRSKFYTVPRSGGLPEPLALPQGYLGEMSADGSHIAYQETVYYDPEWRNYRGGQAQPISVVSTSTWERATAPWDGERHMDPVWMDGVVYYLSERDWASNVWSFDPRTGVERQLTRHADFDVKSLGAGAGAVVYEQAGYLHELDPASGRTRKLEIHVAGDMNWSRPPLGGSPADALPEHRPVADGETRALRVAGRALQRACEGRLVAQPDPDTGSGRSPSGMVAGWLAHRLVQRRRRRVRPGRRPAGRVEPAPHRHSLSVVLLPSGVVARRREAGVYGHALSRARPRCRVRGRRARRHGPVRPPATLAEPGLVSRFAVARVRAPARQPVAGHLPPRHGIAGHASAHRWHGGRDRPGVGRVGQVPLFPRVFRLRTEHRLARHDVLRPPGHSLAAPGAAGRRGALAVPAPQRRGGGRGGRGVGVGEGGRRGRERAGWRAAGGRGDRFRGDRPAHRRCAGTTGEGIHRAGSRPARLGLRDPGRRGRRRRDGVEVQRRGARGRGLPDAGSRRGAARGPGRRYRRFSRPQAVALPVGLRLARRRHRAAAGEWRRTARAGRHADAGRAQGGVLADAPRRLALHARLPVRRQPARGALGRRVGVVLGVAPRRPPPRGLQPPAGHALGGDCGRAFLRVRRRLPRAGESAHGIARRGPGGSRRVLSPRAHLPGRRVAAGHGRPRSPCRAWMSPRATTCSPSTEASCVRP